MKILIACEFSGVVRDAFTKRGHSAVSCNILPTESCGLHYQGDVLEILNQGFDMMIAHPPCTYISNAGACRLYPKKGQLDEERYRLGLKAKEFFMALYEANIQKICVENPVSSTVFKMPPHTQEIQPHMFGHPYTKKTRLWLKGLPPLVATDQVEPIGPYLPAGTGRKIKAKYGIAKRDGKSRSITFQGIADAMAEQWG